MTKQMETTLPVTFSDVDCEVVYTYSAPRRGNFDEPSSDASAEIQAVYLDISFAGDPFSHFMHHFSSGHSQRRRINVVCLLTEDEIKLLEERICEEQLECA